LSFPFGDLPGELLVGKDDFLKVKRDIFFHDNQILGQNWLKFSIIGKLFEFIFQYK
jgi:hypothetical protein